jgi:peptidyl-tRNA hydrolase
VLKKPATEDRVRLDFAANVGVDAIEVILAGGVEQAMNKINGLQS